MQTPLAAHIRESDGTEQSLKAHSVSTARIAAESLQGCGLYSLGYITGLMHDAGKACGAFQAYLRAVVGASENEAKHIKKAPPHAPAGAIFVYERYFVGDDPIRRLAAQIISMAILGHHGGLTDCLAADGDYHSPYLNSILRSKSDICYDEAMEGFLREAASAEELDGLFCKACDELRVFFDRMPADIRSFCASMTARLALGALADADRWDTACFERCADSAAPAPPPRWEQWRESLEGRMARFKTDKGISAIRAGISQSCREAGRVSGAGIYRLTVPTGGGKTLSSLLLAVEQACVGRGNAERLIYVAPFNTILDQNARVIREALNEDELLLEHHADVTLEDDDDETVARHRVLTERWTSRIILTSMVQLLDTLFKGKNTNARRMPRLINSIIIFDEIQALPRKCTVLFECAARFLSDCLGCTVILCTATQPTLRAHGTDMLMTAEKMDAKPPLGVELISDTEALFDKLRRVRFTDERNVQRTNVRAAEDAAAMLRDGKSVLTVVNTKKTAREIFAGLKAANPPEDAVCVHLTTSMCAAHRKSVIDRMIKALDRKKRDPTAPCVCCVSTALIEAGVDISFPVVMRSMAGLPSILQAAGRCNRNGEASLGEVYIMRLSEERLSGLAEIRQGQQDSDGILDRAAREGLCVDRPEMISAYFHQQMHNDVKRPAELFFPVEDSSGVHYLARLLGRNRAMCEAAEYCRFDTLNHLALACNWRTVGREFNVFDEDTVAVITPYGGGKEIIERLFGSCSYEDEKRLLKEAQQYSVNVRRSAFGRLLDERAVNSLGETGAWALREERYDNEIGLLDEEREMELMLK